MGALSWIRETFRRSPVAEVRADTPLGPPTAAQVRRTGYEYGIPLNQASAQTQVAAGSERQQVLTQIHQAYLTCTWVSSAVNLIARTVTAGGLQIVSDNDIPEGELPADPPPVQRLRRLLRFVNPREDMVQLLRAAVIDLMLFGDAYIEVVTLLGEPVALYTLDATTMTVIADLHGEVSGYVQQVDGVRNATFDPGQVIHISLDAPRGGLYGVGPAQLALLPVTAWLFTEATIKECFRRGDPPRLHVDLAHLQDTDVQRWREQYAVNNLGPKAVGTPVLTTGGAQVQVLDGRKVTDYLDAERQLRDQIISAFGVPPAKLGIIETGNLGGGTGEAQDKTWRINTIIPVANLVLEKLNFHLLDQGFGITDFHLEFAEIDYRDSKTVEEIREMRLRSGAYTLNRWRDEIGEPPVEGGDDPIFMERTFIADWANMQDLAKSFIVKNLGGLPDPAAPGDTAAPTADSPAAHPNDLAPPSPPDGDRDPEDGPGLDKDAAQGVAPKESVFDQDLRKLTEAWQRSYRARRRQALNELPKVDQLV